MLACGIACQPTEIQREIEAFQSSTSPVRVATDKGEGFLKSLGNPMGAAALISELVAAELATWFGLKIPPFAIIRQMSIDIIMPKNGVAMLPPLFFSYAVDGTPRDGQDTFPSRLRDPGDIARLVVFDTWIRNWDRFLDGEANSENLLYVRTPGGRKYDLVPIDHSNCFIGDDVDFPTGPAPADWVTDPKVYGKFPEFDSYIDARSVTQATHKLAQLQRNFVVEVVNSVPAEWGLGLNAAKSLVDLICDRAGFVMNTISARLVDAPEIPGLVQ
ncbi:HipA family kinase [Mesorhizobium neociceri]|nr:HipA family kinase [Mesorhizobium neociceri]